MPKTQKIQVVDESFLLSEVTMICRDPKIRIPFTKTPFLVFLESLVESLGCPEMRVICDDCKKLSDLPIPQGHEPIFVCRDKTSQSERLAVLPLIETDTYVIGDLHGDLHSLLVFLRHINFFEAREKPRIVFLGDYLDRGKKSMETLVFVLLLQKYFPDKVVALKGNHEQSLDEIISEFVYNLAQRGYSEISTIQQIIKQLFPVAAVCGTKLFSHSAFGSIVYDSLGDPIHLTWSDSSTSRGIRVLPYEELASDLNALGCREFYRGHNTDDAKIRPNWHGEEVSIYTTHSTGLPESEDTSDRYKNCTCSIIRINGKNGKKERLIFSHIGEVDVIDITDYRRVSQPQESIEEGFNGTESSIMHEGSAEANFCSPNGRIVRNDTLVTAPPTALVPSLQPVVLPQDRTLTAMRILYQKIFLWTEAWRNSGRTVWWSRGRGAQADAIYDACPNIGQIPNVVVVPRIAIPDTCTTDTAILDFLLNANNGALKRAIEATGIARVGKTLSPNQRLIAYRQELQDAPAVHHGQDLR